jgi:AcrR family transcriptional regulator
MPENTKLLSILDAAKTLFWKYGMKKVSVEEICIAAGVSKMTFYKHFANKTELALNILKRNFNEAMSKYREIMDSGRTYPEKIEKGIQLKMENAKAFSREFMNEIYRNGEPEILDFMHQMVSDSLAIFMRDFKYYQDKGEIRKDMKPEFMLYMLNKMTELTADESFMQLFSDPADMVRVVSDFYFYGIMPHEKFEGKK